MELLWAIDIYFNRDECEDWGSNPGAFNGNKI